MNKNRVSDYKKISEILKKDDEICFSDDELREKIKGIDILALYKVAYFENIERRYIEKEYDKLKKPKTSVEIREDYKHKIRNYWK